MQNDTFLNDSGRSTLPISKKAIKRQPIRIPSSYFLAAAAGAVAVSLGIALMSEKKGWANFVGNWVPSLLLLGLYDKIVKNQVSDKIETPSRFH